MKKFYLLSILVFALFSLSYFCGSLRRNFKIKQQSHAMPVVKNHNLDYPTFMNKHLVVVVKGYKESLYWKRCLYSIFDQDYENYQIIYLGYNEQKTEVLEFIKEHIQHKKFQYIANQAEDSFLENLYLTLQFCKDDHIAMVVDAKDFLTNEYVFYKLNQAYANPDVWMTFGNWVEYPSYNMGEFSIKDLHRKKYCRHNVRFTLPTFYVGLFKKIHQEDFLFKEKFFTKFMDCAYILPMLEMTKDRYAVFSEAQYFYNSNDNRDSDNYLFKDYQKCIVSRPEYGNILDNQLFNSSETCFSEKMKYIPETGESR